MSMLAQEFAGALVSAIEQHYEVSNLDNGVNVVPFVLGPEQDSRVRVRLDSVMGAPLVFLEFFNNAEADAVLRVIDHAIDAVIGRE